MPTSRAIDQVAILVELTDIFRSVLGDPCLELSLATTSDDLPGWDSLSHITLVVEAECRFDIEFRTAEIEELTSVSELVRMIQAKLAVVHV
jgi:acyl carrier protein